MTTLDGIVLDLDDTLYETTRLLLPWADRRAAAAMAAAGLRLPEATVLRRLSELRAAGRTAVFAELVRSEGGPEAAVAAAEQAWFDYDPPPMELGPDVRSALDRLSRLAPLALLTSGHPDTQRRKVARLDLAGRFVALRFADFRATGGKTEALGELLRELTWRPDRTVMVGDRPDTDIRAGNTLGCRTVLVRAEDGENAHVPFASPADVPWRVVSHVRELPDLLAATE